MNGPKCHKCRDTGFVIGEPRGHDADCNPLFVQWECDCLARPFRPDWYSPTGHSVKSAMEAKGISREYLSCALGEADNDWLDLLLEGAVTVTPRTATVLASELGGTQSFWLRRDAKYWEDRLRIDGGK